MEVISEDCELPNQSVLGSCKDRLSFCWVVIFCGFTVFSHEVFLLLNHYFESLLLLEQLAQHDKGCCDEVRLGSEAELKNSFDKGENSISVAILLKRDKEEIEEDFCQGTMQNFRVVDEIIEGSIKSVWNRPKEMGIVLKKEQIKLNLGLRVCGCVHYFIDWFNLGRYHFSDILSSPFYEPKDLIQPFYWIQKETRWHRPFFTIFAHELLEEMIEQFKESA